MIKKKSFNDAIKASYSMIAQGLKLEDYLSDTHELIKSSAEMDTKVKNGTYLMSLSSEDPKFSELDKINYTLMIVINSETLGVGKRSYTAQLFVKPTESPEVYVRSHYNGVWTPLKQLAFSV